jgi:hypothetical protein
VGWLVTGRSYYLLNLSENIGSFTKKNRFVVSELMVLKRLLNYGKKKLNSDNDAHH